ncbi:MAG: amidohydrolase family protein [Spirochaetales bacterium]
MRIDAHHHFWKYNPEEYGWIEPSQTILMQDYLPVDLQQELEPLGISGVVSVQARQTLYETRTLLSYADQYPFILGVVGWVPLLSPARLQPILDSMASHPRFKGVRHVIQDEPDDSFILRRDFNEGISLLREYDLTYDILVFHRHLVHVIPFIDRHPNQTFILDHIGKPDIAHHQMEPWRSHIREIARRENVYCKVSGMVTESMEGWTVEDLEPYWETVLECFGPSRLMFGSDWPVCLCRTEYERWWNVVFSWASSLSDEESKALLGGTAQRVYRLVPTSES